MQVRTAIGKTSLSNTNRLQHSSVPQLIFHHLRLKDLRLEHGIGLDATATTERSIAIGDKASATTTSALAIGLSSSSSGTNAIAIGVDAAVSNLETIALTDTKYSFLTYLF